jgi:hypothetical protein
MLMARRNLMIRVYYVFSLIPLILVLAFYLLNKYGPGGQAGLGNAIATAEAITISCPIITLVGVVLIGVNAANHKSVLGVSIATLIAVLPGIIFWIIEHRGL